MKTLIVYYSLEGNTDYAAKKIAERTGADLILHITEAIEAVRASAENGGFYTMKTTCERPEAIPPGVQADKFR